MTDNIDDLMADLYWLGSGWHRHVNPETGAVALFPETAKDDDQWQARAIQMHAAQVPVTLAPKPLENAMRRIVRAD